MPSEARDAFALRFPVLAENRFTLAFCLATPFIGAKWGASAVFLSHDGECYATLVWLKLRLRSFERSETIFACHSLLPNGDVLSTAPVRQAIWIPEMIPPGVKLNRLPESTPPEEVIRAHRDRVRLPPMAAQLLDENSLRGHMLQSAQRLFEHLVGKGYYRRLSEAEVGRLKSMPS